MNPHLSYWLRSLGIALMIIGSTMVGAEILNKLFSFSITIQHVSLFIIFVGLTMMIFNFAEKQAKIIEKRFKKKQN